MTGLKCNGLSMSAAHPYEGYIKTLKFGDKEGKYFDLLRLGGEKYGRLQRRTCTCILVAHA